MNFISSLILTVIGVILRALFALVSYSYNMIIALSKVNLFGTNAFDDGGWWQVIISRLYILLGVFMLFRVAFSLLQYIASPDKMSDKQQGIGSIVKRTIVALTILVMFQPVLKFAMDLQQTIVEENILGKIILGTTGDEKNYQRNFGDILPSTVITSLTSVNKDWDTANGGACSTSEIDLTKLSVADINYYHEETGSDYHEAADKCVEQINNNLDSGYNFEDLMVASNFYKWFDQGVIGADSGWVMLKPTIFSNNFLLFAIVAIGFIFCMLSLGLQLGVRVIKLAFLALIAPIPIIGYIEPKGSSMFTKWLKELLNTYLMLFIRLAALYFAILIIIIVSRTTGLTTGLVDYNGNPVVDDNFVSDFLVTGQLKIVIFLAAFLFADQVPKMIENIFGLKMEGGMFKSPFKQMRESKAMMGTVGRVAGAGLAAGALFAKNPTTGLSKIGDFRKNWKEGWDATKEGSLKDRASFVATQAARAGTLVGSIGRNGRDMSKYLKDHPEEGFFENIQDSQVKNEERINNRLSRQSSDMWGKMFGFDKQLENEKARLEDQKQTIQVEKSKIDEQMRVDKENAEKEKSLKAGQDALTKFGESEAEKKSDILTEHLNKVSEAKTVAEEAKVQVSKAEAELDAAIKLRDSEKTKLEADMAGKTQLQSSLDAEIADLKSKSFAASSDEMKTNIDAQIEAKQKQRVSVAADLQATASRIQGLDAAVEQATQDLKDKKVIAEQASAAHLHLDRGLKDEKGNVVVQGTQDLKDEIAQAIIKVTQLTGTSKEGSITDRERELAACADKAKAQTTINGFEVKLTQYEEYLQERAREIEKMRLNIENQEKNIVALMQQESEETDEKVKENLQNQISRIQRQHDIAVEMYQTADINLKDGKEAVKVARELKENEGYYVIDDIKDSEGNVVVHGMKSGFKAMERAGINLESASEKAYGTEARNLEKALKQTNNQIDELAKQIKDIQEKTKGAGVANETWNVGDFGNSGPDGPMGPPPGE